MIEQPDKERWKDVIGYEGLYQVSNLGRVKSVDRLTTDKNGRTYTVKGKILNQSKVGDYLRVSLYTNNVARGKLVHRLVAEAFIPNPNKYEIVNHKDENKLNNCSDNLEWCTQSYNLLYSKCSIRPANSSIGKKIILKVAQDGSTIERYKSIGGAARSNKIDVQMLRSIIRRGRVLNGYIWIELAT